MGGRYTDAKLHMKALHYIKAKYYQTRSHTADKAVPRPHSPHAGCVATAQSIDFLPASLFTFTYSCPDLQRTRISTACHIHIHNTSPSSLEATSYVVRQELLTYHSRFFRATFKGGFKEAEDRKVRLEEVDKDTFEIFVH